MTLEQLIEACGDKQITATRLNSKYQSSKAPRDSGDQRLFGGYEVAVSNNETEDDYHWEWGATLEEAVQKLYDHLKENNLL